MNQILLMLGIAALLNGAHDDAKTAIKKIIADNFKSMQAAKTKADIERALDAMDVRELPDG